jgi:hypothetical protein
MREIHGESDKIQKPCLHLVRFIVRRRNENHECFISIPKLKNIKLKTLI